MAEVSADSARVMVIGMVGAMVTCMVGVIGTVMVGVMVIGMVGVMVIGMVGVMVVWDSSSWGYSHDHMPVMHAPLPYMPYGPS